MALSATADAALVSLFCITRELILTLLAKMSKAPWASWRYFFFRPVLLAESPEKNRFAGEKIFQRSFPICIRLIVDKLFKPSVPSTW